MRSLVCLNCPIPNICHTLESLVWYAPMNRLRALIIVVTFPFFLNLLFLNCMALDMVIINGIPFKYQMQLSHFHVLQRGLPVGYCMCSV